MPAPTLPTVTLSNAKPAASRADALIVAIRGDDLGEFADDLKAVGLNGKPRSVATIPANGRVKARTIVAVRLPGEPTTDELRACAAVAVRALKSAKTAAIDFPAESPDDVAAVVEGVRLGAYRFDRYKTGADDTRLESATVLTPHARQKVVADAADAAHVVTDAVAQARDWANTAPGDLRPPVFADAIAAAAAAGVTVTIWDEKRLAKEKCGGILGVGRGSEVPPRLVRLEYKPKDAAGHLALVGKGITFDSGGLSIKPGTSMATMKLDMCGAAAVAAAISAIATLKLPIRVTAFACLAENMPSGSAIRPGDVLTIRNGSTVEVLNTDAEGRLVLADGLSLAVEAKPDRIIDVATLTGACMIALGMRTTGVFGSDDVAEQVLDAAVTSGEPMWRLPLTEEMPELLKSSKVADLAQHNPKPQGGAIYAAAFLREFTGGLPWAHLDIAGPSFNEGGPYGEVPSGGTGVAVRTLVQLARDLATN